MFFFYPTLSKKILTCTFTIGWYVYKVELMQEKTSLLVKQIAVCNDWTKNISSKKSSNAQKTEEKKNVKTMFDHNQKGED